jgi:hypothetical protein
VQWTAVRTRQYLRMVEMRERTKYLGSFGRFGAAQSHHDDDQGGNRPVPYGCLPSRVQDLDLGQESCVVLLSTTSLNHGGSPRNRAIRNNAGAVVLPRPEPLVRDRLR